MACLFQSVIFQRMYRNAVATRFIASVHPRTVKPNQAVINGLIYLLPHLLLRKSTELSFDSYSFNYEATLVKTLI